jgi:hypothetical protein
VPIAVLHKGEPTIQGPITSLTGDLSSEQESKLTVTILNSNTVPLEKTMLRIPELGADELLLGTVGPNETRSVEITIVPPMSGDVSVQVTIRAEVAGTLRQFSDARVLSVKPGQRERMRRSTRRTLDDEEM